jgi:hypothetical protein
MNRTLASTLAAAALLAVPAVGVAAVDTAATPAAAKRGEVRIVGTVTQLSSAKITVADAGRSLVFTVRTATLTAGINVGDRVEAEGRRLAGRLTLVKIHRDDHAGAVLAAARHGADDAPGDDHGRHGRGHA